MPKIKRESRQFIVIDEEKLITEVQNRPILYDKALKGYRKPAIREGAWLEVANSLQNSVDECKKRWRSLRDAFMKQYKQYQRDDQSIKKKWLFYDKMEFLAPFFENLNNIRFFEDELIEQDDDMNNGSDQQVQNQTQNQTHTQINKVTVTSRPSIVCISQPSEYQPHHIDLEYEEAEQLDDDDEPDNMLSTKQLITNTKKEIIQTPVNAQIYSQVYTTTNDDDLHQQANSLQTKTLQPYSSIDPDERFLLSCVPIFHRLSNKKNALARLKIQQLLYEIEFDGTDSLVTNS